MSPTNLLNRSIKGGATLLGAVGLGAIAFLGMPDAAKAANILKGTEYFISPAGGSDFIFDTDKLNAQLSLGLPAGQQYAIPMKGLPGTPSSPNVPGKWPSDTVVKRLSDAVFDDDGDGILERTEDTIDIQMTELFLGSVAPVAINGFNYDLLATLDPAQDTLGEMTIKHNFTTNGTDNFFDDSGSYQGTFTSYLNVHYQVEFTPTNGGPAIGIFKDLLQLTQGQPPSPYPPAQWSHTPPIGGFLLRGEPGDGDANCHKISGPGCFLDNINVNGNDVAFGDFFPIGKVKHSKNHTTELTQVPEPLTILGTGVVLGALPVLKKKYAKNNKNKDGEA